MILKEKILFDSNECKSIIWDEDNKITKWSISNRKYDSCSIFYNDNNNWIFEKLKYFFESETNIKLTKLKEEIHFHKFIKGDWFGEHNDQKGQRLFAVGVLLNDSFIGGDFIFYNDGETIINKKIGNSYIFDVRMKHEIKPIVDGIRYSLLWFLELDNIKIETNKLV